MKDFFTTTIGAWDDGSVRLTAPGIAVVVSYYCTSRCSRSDYSPQGF